MPISPIVLQRRHAELGRIRLGDKGAKGQPQKLTRFRITSPNRRHIEDIATLYGGEARPWDNAGKAEFEVYTDATSIPCIVVRGGISQWLETWSGGGCTHRCDGIENALTGEACNPDDPAHVNAKPTTRLSVMLRDLDAIGVWRLESHGWNAAAELPGLVELAMHVGELVPANLYLAERKVIKDGRTSRFIVPGLDLEVSPGRLAAIVSGQAEAAALAAPATAPAAISATPAMDADDWTDAIADATTEGELRALWDQAQSSGAPLQVADRIRARLAEVRAEQEPQPLPATDDPSTLDDVWFAVTGEAGKQGLSTADLEQDFTAFSGHASADATADEMRGYLDHLRSVKA